MEPTAVKSEPGSAFPLRAANWYGRQDESPANVDPVFSFTATVTYTQGDIAPPSAPKQEMSRASGPTPAQGLGLQSFPIPNTHSQLPQYSVLGETIHPQGQPPVSSLVRMYLPAVPIVPSQGPSIHQVRQVLTDVPTIKPSSRRRSLDMRTPNQKKRSNPYPVIPAIPRTSSLQATRSNACPAIPAIDTTLDLQANRSNPYPIIPAAPKTSYAIPPLSTSGTPNYFTSKANLASIIKPTNISVSYESKPEIPASSYGTSPKGLQVLELPLDCHEFYGGIS
jgi:hypothetical protein